MDIVIFNDNAKVPRFPTHENIFAACTAARLPLVGMKLLENETRW